ncbi:TetR/AcrR family transcriptional regulator [Mycolicibacillus parakoreensis]|uniref:TetR/AcrR family transcriptional regulator n=1 Tax=Mycolicibacillus parakoreensis TaxID=1069221 RepID=A0ABY3U9X0_9MYCO|nr:TetR/AcrR family transcriptional regulator [Mycolicibacillus parakoreensis]MCV7317503.1 TetR/AcrR family transcriptional regulator [Mycolicibacillus parakoreensis]ULN54220.1 TetR/AcrR family transcriptional regulator [Mycolicibacillus parakoreensis]
MPRPRRHDLESILDAVEDLTTRSGTAAVTIRALARASGVSNGAIYHAFGSRAAILGHAWLRAAHRFLDIQRSQITAAADADPVESVVVAAEAAAVLAERHPGSAAVLLALDRPDLVAAGVPAALVGELTAVQDRLVEVLADLADRMWRRRDGAAVAVITTCVVDLPTAILLTRGRLTHVAARQQLRAAVRAVAAVGPPDRTRRR